MQGNPAAPTNQAILDPYKPLPGKKQHRILLTSAAPFTPTYVTSLVKQPNAQARQNVYASRIQSRQILLENPARESKAKQAREQRDQRLKVEKERKKLGVMGKREAAARGVWTFDKSQARFDLFLPLHHLWLGYMSELHGLPAPPSDTSAGPMYTPTPASMHAKLVKADYHGAYITVSDAKNTPLVGLNGIVIHESENAFRIITEQDKVKLIPKQNTIFNFAVPLYSSHIAVSSSASPPIPHTQSAKEMRTVIDMPHLLFTLYGNQFRFRAAERAGRKFKAKETIEL